ncbi:MAG TPA: hypothetical protein PLD27_02265 [bacterium]|nr:hypothetical protein [bacterium]HOL47010.1 hypothetical protein [bacterium]HPQ18488.1 hypothetical protein [bacterium]
MKKIIIFLSLLILFNFACSKKDENIIRFLFTGAISGKIEECEDCGYKPVGGFGRIKSFFEKLTIPDKTIKFDCGNIFKDYQENKPNDNNLNLIKKFLKIINYDFFSLGVNDNHNDYLSLNSEILCSNIIFRNNEKIKSEIEYKFKIHNNEIIIRFFSIFEDNDFDTNFEYIKNKLLDKENKKKINVLIAAIDYKKIKKISENCPNINFIIWSYKHNALLNERKINNSILLSPGILGETGGQLDLIFDDNGKLINYKTILHSLSADDFEYDKSIAKIINEEYLKANQEIDKNAIKNFYLEKEVVILFFTRIGCRWCKNVDEILRIIKKENPKIKVVKLYENSTNIKYHKYFSKKFNFDEKESLLVPLLIIGDDYLLSNQIKVQSIIELIKKYAKEGAKSPLENISSEELKTITNALIKEFSFFSIFTIILAGLIDGINPCAFVTILFLISVIYFKLNERLKILVIGFSFIAGVFIIYFFIGQGILTFIFDNDIYYKISFILNLSIAIITFSLGILSFYDAINIKKSRNKVFLQLPISLKKYSHYFIRNIFTKKFLILFSFLTGCIISILEFTCTGQVYLPTLIFIREEFGFLSSATLFLFIYNLFFILPLLLILLFAYFGFSSEQLNKFFSRHLVLIKILTGIFFFFIGIYLFYNGLPFLLDFYF